MNIQYLVTSLEGGGGTFSLPPILRLLERAGCQIQITACEARDGLGGRRLREQGFAYTLLSERKRSKAFYIHAFLKQVRHSRPDVIWTSLSVAGLVGQCVGRLCGIPVVSWMNNARQKLHTRALSRLSALWIADSSSVGRFLHETLHVPAERVMVWPLYRATTAHSITRYWNGSGCLHLGSLGRLNAQKNYATLIRGIARFISTAPHRRASLRVSLAGDGPLRASLQALITQYGLDDCITLIGHQHNPDAFLLTLDAYIQPSLYEGLCLAAHEAMAIGLPVIATPVGELAHSIIADRTGFVIGHPAEDSIAAILESIFAQPEKLEHYGRAGQSLIRAQFSAQKFDQAGHAVLRRIETLIAPIAP